MSASDGLAERLKFLGFDEQASAKLRSSQAVVMDALPKALDAFYAHIQDFEEPRSRFPSQAMMDGAKARQLAHWKNISDAEFGSAYQDQVRAVGAAHARIGLEPKWYIGGYALILEAITGALLKARWPKGLTGRPKPGANDTAEEAAALIKAGLLDMDIAISVYIDLAEAAKRESEARARAANEAVLREVGKALEELSAGNLKYRISGDMPPEYASLKSDFNDALAKLGQTMVMVRRSIDHINSSADELATASDELSKRTENQAANLEETAAALDQITVAVGRSAEGAAQANHLVTLATDDARRSDTVVTKAVSAMGAIEDSSQHIGQIVGVIDEIAFQTNLLALNAGIEAARAGDSGRGFAVVATEVRALAQRSADAAKEIKTLIAASSRQVENGVELVGETGSAITAIARRFSDTDALVGQIAASAQEQSSALHQVNVAVNQVDHVVQQNAAMVEESAAAIHSLKFEAIELARLINAFRVEGAQTSPPQSPRVQDPRSAISGGTEATRRVSRGRNHSSWQEF